jgi:anthranilate phosphoribosyltransferase
LEWIPSDFGVEQTSSSDLAGGDRVVNCRIATAILHGEGGPQRDIVLVNAAAALLAAGVVPDLREAMLLAEESVNSGAAWEKVERLVAFTSASARETRNEKRETES